MPRICVNAKMRDEVDRQVASRGKITCVLLTGVDSDTCVLVKTLTSLYGYRPGDVYTSDD